MPFLQIIHLWIPLAVLGNLLRIHDRIHRPCERTQKNRRIGLASSTNGAVGDDRYINLRLGTRTFPSFRRQIESRFRCEQLFLSLLVISCSGPGKANIRAIGSVWKSMHPYFCSIQHTQNGAGSTSSEY